MPNLAILEEPRTFPPKKFLLGLWGVTLLVALYGIIITPMIGGWALGPLSVWVVISGIAFWQIWSVRWVQVDNDGIRMRNLFRRGRELRWADVKEFHEEEVRLSKRPYIIIHLSNRGGEGVVRITKIQLTNDQVEFEMLRQIVREAVPQQLRRES